MNSISANKKIKIGLVDDHQLFVNVVGNFLKSKELDVVFGVISGFELFTLLGNNIIPDIVLLDIKMPGMDGIECLKKLRVEYPAIRVIIYSMYEDTDFMLYCISLGAHCYLPKTIGTDEFMHALNEVHAKGFYYSDGIDKAITTRTTD